MADDYLDLAHMLKVNDANLSDAEISEVFEQAPVAARLFSQESSNGEYHKFIKYDTAPTVGFRDINDGLENTQSNDTVVSTQLTLLDASFAVDSALADLYKNGRTAYVQMEAKRHLATAMFGLEKQFIYGTTSPGNSSGFAGIMSLLGASLLGGRVQNAGSSTANEQTSVYFVNTGFNKISALYKADQIQIGETREQRMAGSTGWYTGLWTPIQGWYGLQLASVECVARICNIHPTSNSGANALTDDMIYNTLAQFRGGYKPDFMVMSRAALNMLRKSRTATNATGAPAPVPTEVEGVPIIVSEAISNTEAVVA